jgi:hypothetical protein
MVQQPDQLQLCIRLGIDPEFDRLEALAEFGEA